MTTILTYGTFDLLHVGHVRLLNRLARLGDQLVIGLSTDEFNWGQKGKTSVFSYAERYEILASLAMVDRILPESNWEQKESDIERENADIFAIGDDWSGKFDYLADRVQVIYTPRTPDISTTAIKQVVGRITEDKLVALGNSLRHSLSLVNELKP